MALRFMLVAVLVLSSCDKVGGAPDVGQVVDDVDTFAPDTRVTEVAPTAADTTTDDTDDADDMLQGDDANDTAIAPDDVAEDGAASDTLDEVDADLPTTYELTMTGWSMRPGEEATKCVLVKLPNDKPVRVKSIRTNLSKGSHHLVLYKSSATWSQSSPYPCTPFTEFLGGENVPLAITQVREETIALPPGVAYELPAHQVLRFEAHYLNYFTEDIDAEIKVWLDLVPDDEPTEKADILFYGNISVYVPAHQKDTSAWHQIDVPEGLYVYAMTGHTHALGTNFEVQRSHGDSQVGPSLYPPAGTSFDWDDPPIAHFDPPLHFTDPGDGFRFRCTWNNTTDHDVDFGESATQEMCFLWGYYWPSVGPLIRFD